MNETEWLACADPVPMLEFLRGRASDRKLRLFAVACCRLVGPALAAIGDPACLAAVTAVEDRADGPGTDDDLPDLRHRAHLAVRRHRNRIRGVVGPHPAYQAAEAVYGLTHEVTDRAVADVLFFASHAGRWDPEARHVRWDEEKVEQTRLVRDIFKPFRPVALDPRWRTADVLGLARGIYEDRAFDRLSLLADALMDAGCEEEQLLAHCRSEGPHVRGCWVVDLVLDKE